MEVRLAFGAESDERFAWTRFDLVLDPETKPDCKDGGWADYTPPAPLRPGLTVYDDYPLQDLLGVIDWTPFFQTWDLAGRYPAVLTSTRRRRFVHTVLSAKGIRNPVLSFEEIGTRSRPAERTPLATQA